MNQYGTHENTQHTAHTKTAHNILHIPLIQTKITKTHITLNKIYIAMKIKQTTQISIDQTAQATVHNTFPHRKIKALSKNNIEQFQTA